MAAPGGHVLERVDRHGLAFYRKEAWAGLRHGIFTRQGGVSQAPFASLNLGASIGDDLANVRENQRRMYAAAGVNPERAASSWLVHGVKVLVVNGQPRGSGSLEKADAMITDQPDLPLVMRFADCVPLLLYDPLRRVIGLGHAGWRGTVKGMAGGMVKRMGAEYGSSPEDIQALIGPAISRRNYAVGDDVAAVADAYFGAEAGVIARDPVHGKPSFDLLAANRLDLARNGVAQVDAMEACTYENTDEFYSHRAEDGATGRFGVVISL